MNINNLVSDVMLIGLLAIACIAFLSLVIRVDWQLRRLQDGEFDRDPTEHGFLRRQRYDFCRVSMMMITALTALIGSLAVMIGARFL